MRPGGGVARRPDGALEHEVLGVLWQAKRAMTPGEVREALGGDLAYTTVMTVLGRLHDKGVVSRAAHGRGYAYRATVSESELTARRMGEALATARDRAAALSGFVSSLSKKDAAVLRRAMDDTAT
jgi:predicted transcriptional regulator